MSRNVLECYNLYLNGEICMSRSEQLCKLVYFKIKITEFRLCISLGLLAQTC